MNHLQPAIYNGELDDDDGDMLEVLLDFYEALPTLNRRILTKSPDAPQLQLAGPLLGIAPLPRVAGVGGCDRSGGCDSGGVGGGGNSALRSLGYLHSPGTEDLVKGVTHWVVADFATQV